MGRAWAENGDRSVVPGGEEGPMKAGAECGLVSSSPCGKGLLQCAERTAGALLISLLKCREMGADEMEIGDRVNELSRHASLPETHDILSFPEQALCFEGFEFGLDVEKIKE